MAKKTFANGIRKTKNNSTTSQRQTYYHGKQRFEKITFTSTGIKTRKTHINTNTTGNTSNGWQKTYPFANVIGKTKNNSTTSQGHTLPCKTKV